MGVGVMAHARSSSSNSSSLSPPRARAPVHCYTATRATHDLWRHISNTTTRQRGGKRARQVREIAPLLLFVALKGVPAARLPNSIRTTARPRLSVEAVEAVAEAGRGEAKAGNANESSSFHGASAPSVHGRPRWQQFEPPLPILLFLTPGQADIKCLSVS